MINPTLIDDLTKRVAALLPPGVQQFQSELEKNIHAVLQATFAKLDLVTREEFDVQCAVLARTRRKVDELEKQVTLLESHLEALSTQKRSRPKRDVSERDDTTDSTA